MWNSETKTKLMAAMIALSCLGSSAFAQDQGEFGPTGRRGPPVGGQQGPGYPGAPGVPGYPMPGQSPWGPAPEWGYGQTQDWPGYDNAWGKAGQVYQLLMRARRQANMLAASSRFDQATQTLFKGLQDVQAIAAWPYNRPSPHTVAMAQAGLTIGTAVINAAAELGHAVGSQVRFITLNKFFSALFYAYQLDTDNYRRVAMDPYGEFPDSYFSGMQKLAKMVLNIQEEIGRAQASNKVELKAIIAVSQAARRVLANSVFRRSFEQVGWELVFIEQVAVDLLQWPYIDNYQVEELRSRMGYAASLIDTCRFIRLPKPHYRGGYPRGPGEIDY